MAFPRRTNRENIWSQVAFYSSLGFIIPGAVIGGVLLGWFLDQYLHTAPILSIIGGIAGAVAGIVEIYQILTRAEKSADRDRSSSKSGRS